MIQKIQPVRYNVLIIFGLLFSSVALFSCKKDRLNAGNPAAIQVFNAMNDGSVGYVSLVKERPEVFRTARLLSNKGYATGTNIFAVDYPQFVFMLYARPDTMPHHAAALSAEFDVEMGQIYSMFIYGSKSTADYFVIKDQIPPLGGMDSTMYIRFANVSEGHEISVNRVGEPVGSFVRRLSLHQVSEFVSMNAKKSVSKYDFEIRDFNTEELITTFSATDINVYNGYSWMNTSNTLVVTGTKGGTGNLAPVVTRMNHR